MQHATTTLPETTMGLDIGDRFTHGCVLDATASVAERLRFPTTRSGLAKAFSDRPACRVALEVGTHSPWMSRALEAMGLWTSRALATITSLHEASSPSPDSTPCSR